MIYIRKNHHFFKWIWCFFMIFPWSTFNVSHTFSALSNTLNSLFGWPLLRDPQPVTWLTVYQLPLVWHIFVISQNFQTKLKTWCNHHCITQKNINWETLCIIFQWPNMIQKYIKAIFQILSFLKIHAWKMSFFVH